MAGRRAVRTGLDVANYEIKRSDIYQIFMPVHGNNSKWLSPLKTLEQMKTEFNGPVIYVTPRSYRSLIFPRDLPRLKEIVTGIADRVAQLNRSLNQIPRLRQVYVSIA